MSTNTPDMSPTHHYMTLALSEAQNAYTRGEVPVGAVLVDSVTGHVIATTSNRVEEIGDPTAHAELLAIRIGATLRQEQRLNACDLYVTLEPCTMCAGALAHARIRRIIFGAYDTKGGAIEQGCCVFEQDTIHHKPEIIGGVMEQQCADMLKKFFRERR